MMFQVWAGYQRKRHEYQNSLVHMLWDANLDNNSGALQRLISQVEQEEFKEALLTYVFLFPPSDASASHAADTSHGDTPSGVLAVDVATRVEAWLEERFGEHVAFDVHDGLDKVVAMGLARKDDASDRYLPVPVDAAIHTLRARCVVGSVRLC